MATRTRQPPVIDGDLSDRVWAQAIPITEFTQQSPDEGRPPSQRTEVRILYDDRAIYFAFRCFDTDPKTLVANMTRRDRDVSSDAIWLDIDTHGDHQSAYRFELSAAGVQRDGIRTGDRIDLGAVDWHWDAVWQSAARLDGNGWTGEIAVPLGELRYLSFESVVWRVEIRRFIARRSEIDQWILIPRTRFSEMLWYGPLTGVDGLRPTHSLRLMPFVLEKTRNRWSPPSLNMIRGIDSGFSAGLDALYGVTSDLTLTATVLPDFGQVEADEVKLNLTNFELNYPEKRPFFLEQVNLYTFLNMYGLPQIFTQPFYSRRIGAAPSGPYLAAGQTVMESPPSTQILTAGKLTGRIGKKLNVAFLEALTGSETATLASQDGTQTTQKVAPLTNFFVGRLTQEWARNFTGGLMATSVLRRESPGSLQLDGHCPGTSTVATNPRCTHDATTTALDMNWRSADGGYVSHASLYGSLISGGPPRAQRDGTIIGSGDTGVGWLLQAAKASGRFTGRLAYEAGSPRFDLNDAGFLQSQNVHRITSTFWWTEYNVGPTRQMVNAAEIIGRNSWDGVRTVRSIDLSSRIDWNNVWYTEFHLKRLPTIFDNRETLDGARTERAAQWEIDWTWRTDRTRPFYSELIGSALTTWQGYNLSVSESAVYRPSGRFEISLAPTLTRVTGDPRSVSKSDQGCPSTNGDSKTYCFGLQSAVATGVTFRTVLTFMPTMTLQTYAQLFLSSVRYGQIFETTKFVPKPNIHLSDLEPSARDPSAFYARDSVVNINAVFRWEYLPGSVLYLVYTRAQAGGLAPLQLDAEGRPIQPFLDLGALSRGPSEDVFLVKLSYLFAR